MVAKDRSGARDSPNAKAEVGEIDTRAPFQSVKDAVTLFGEGAFSGERPAIRKPKPYSAEKVLAKETQLHLAEKDLKKLKDQLSNAETTRTHALAELEKAKLTVGDLKSKLKILHESKESAFKASEEAKARAKKHGEENNVDEDGSVDSWKLEFESARTRYSEIITELDAAKQELRKVRQDSEVSAEEKIAALKRESEAKDGERANRERIGELSKEIASAKRSTEQVKQAFVQAQTEQAKIFSEKDSERLTHKLKLEESAERLSLLKNELDPGSFSSLESKLAETESEIGETRKQTESAKASGLELVRTVTSELDDAKCSLQRVAEEESSLRILVESLKLELEKAKRELSEAKEREAETESAAGDLSARLRETKSELESRLAGETRARSSCNEMISTLNQLSLEAEEAKRESEGAKSEAEALKKEAEETKIEAREVEKKLRVAEREAEEAESAEREALERIKALSEETNVARTSISSSGGTGITISRDEFESLSRKVGESEKLAGMKVAAAEAQAAAVRAGENEALKKLENARKEIEEMKSAASEAEKRAEMAEAAKKAVEGELKRWREREQKKAAETAARILAETAALASPETSPTRFSPARDRKLEKEKSSASSKKALMPNLSGIFNRKRNQIEGGSPSYLPGERPI